jgi:protein-S-isoprenylcysteine O-methyltransferase Ste14
MTMELFPALSLGWRNGWIALALLVLSDGTLFLSFPKPIVARLWDRSQWNRKQRIFTAIGKLISLGGLILIVFTPLKIGAPVFPAGGVIVLVGLTLVIVSVLNFAATPLDQPVTRGLYRISRHPQVVGAGLVLLGASIAIGSWAAVILWMLGHLFGHWGLLAEEEACLKQYGDSYREYLQRVPRYFVFF